MEENNKSMTNATNGMAIAGFVLSFFFGLLGLIFSIIGLNKSKITGEGRGLSIAGIVISIVGILFKVIMFFVFLLTVNTFVQ